MKNHTTILALSLVAALAAGLVASGIVAMASSAAASDGNSGISIPTITVQKQKCQTAGGTSPVTDACTATSTNTIDESGGVIGGTQDK
jgi:hypothetical protein